MDKHATRGGVRWEALGLGAAAAAVLVALVTALARWTGANATTAGFVYLLLVLGMATWGGWGAGVVTSLLATVCYNYFFLPPTGTLTISQPANWVALASFLASSALASRLVVSARRQAAEADARRREVEMLYELCFGLFAAGQRPGAIGEAAGRTLSVLGSSAGRLLLPASGGEWTEASAIGEGDEADRRQLDLAREAHHPVTDERGNLYLPLEVGGHLSGVLMTRGVDIPLAVLDPAGRLLALAIERERLLAESAHLEAVRESDALKTSLLRAVSHDLRTPLTAMRAEVESLGSRLGDRPEAVDALRRVALEQERLARRIDNLLALARLEAGVARPRPEPTPAAGVFRSARESLASVLAGRPVRTRVEPDCPDLLVDPSLALEIVVNLLENAARSSAPDRPIELTATADPGDPRQARVEILDRGPGMPAGPDGSGGLGLRIARSFAEASGGVLRLLDRPGGGTVARLTVPALPAVVLEDVLEGAP
jgi:two-component system sensor histidine kinase KdpD